MACGLINISCHIQTAIWEFWANVGILNKVLIGGGVLALALGVSWSLLSLIKRLGGWPAVLGAVAVIVGVVLAMLPQKPKPSPVEQFPEDHPDTKGPFEFGVNKTRSKKKRPTILDSLKGSKK